MRQASRMSDAASSSPPSAFTARASATLPSAVVGSCSEKKARTAEAGFRATSRASSARRPSAAMTGQSGLSRLKAVSRSNPIGANRTATHAVNVRSSGSVNSVLTRSPLSKSPFRYSSMARRKALSGRSGPVTPTASRCLGSLTGSLSRCGSSRTSAAEPPTGFGCGLGMGESVLSGSALASSARTLS